MQDRDITSILKDLITICEDGKNGFAEAHEMAVDPELKSLFGRCATECDLSASELSQISARYGGSPSDSGSVSAALHRGWIKVKSSMENTDRVLLEEVERGQDRAKSHYLAALKRELPSEVRLLVERQAAGALRNHDLIRDLRDSYKAAA